MANKKKRTNDGMASVVSGIIKYKDELGYLFTFCDLSLLLLYDIE